MWKIFYQWLDFRTIAGKIRAAVLAFGLAMASVLGVVGWQNQQAQALSQRVAQLHAKVSTITVHMRGDLNYVAMTQFRQLLTAAPGDARTRHRTWQNYLRTDYDTLRQFGPQLTPAERLDLDTLGQWLKTMEAYQDQVDTLIAQGRVAAVPDSVAVLPGQVRQQAIIDQISELRYQARLKLKDVSDHRQQLLQTETQAISLAIARTNRFLIVIALVASGLFLTLAWHLRRTVRQSLRQASAQLSQLAQGGLAQPSELPPNELATVLQAGNALNEHLKAVAKFAQAVGEGSFEAPFTPAGPQDTLGQALVAMKNRLQQAAQHDQQRQWASQGLQTCAELVNQHRSGAELLAKLWLAAVVKHLAANQAALFLGEENGPGLRLAASYAYGRPRVASLRLAPGEGLAGQVFLEKASQCYTQVPADYVRIKSGLGEASPRNLLIVPLLANQTAVGVLELASFTAFAPHQIAWAEQVANQLALGLR
ncbi:MAG: GAF domain-containing protein [Bernardetiaceae bacterium]|jgi:hypothetical protein|nr:GAF domain-containing protein [Bernardetiaceae bacterium]